MIVETFRFHVMIRELNRIYHTFETIRMSQTLKGGQRSLPNAVGQGEKFSKRK